METHPGLAAWVQGVMSVVAIVAGWWLAQRSERARQAQARVEREAKARDLSLLVRDPTERWGGRLFLYAKWVRDRRPQAILEGIEESVLSPPQTIAAAAAELHKLGDAAEPLQRAIYWAQKAASMDGDVVEVVRWEGPHDRRDEVLNRFEGHIQKAVDGCLDAIRLMRAHFGD